jgi:dUTP pyrophosphatase
MDEKILRSYLEKLENFEEVLGNTDEGEVDERFIQDIENTLSQLSSDVGAHVNSQSDLQGFGLNVKIKLIDPEAKLPSYSNDGDGCVDLHCTSYEINEQTNQITYKTGIALEIPPNYVGLVFPRSSIRRTRLSLSNSVGVIDSGYRGEIIATFNMTNSTDTTIYEKGERICQLMILPYPKINFIPTDDLSDTSRGTGGFGSTGK